MSIVAQNQVRPQVPLWPNWYVPPVTPFPKDIIDDIAAAHCVLRWDILGRCRERRIVRARWAVMRALRDKGMTVQRIGKILGRDHSTVLHGLRK